MALEVLERGADGVQAPRVRHRCCRRRKVAVHSPLRPPPLDDHVAVGGAAAAARKAGAGGEGDDGVAELVVEVPDALLQGLCLRSRRRRLPSHLIHTIRSSPLEKRENWGVEQEGRHHGARRVGVFLQPPVVLTRCLLLDLILFL